MKKVFAKDYGIFPNRDYNYTHGISEMLKSAGNGSEIIFEPGTYRFDISNTLKRRYSISNTSQAPQHSIAVLLEGMQDIVLDFDNSELLYSGWQIPIAVDNCKNIAIKNAKIDWAIPTSAEGQVISADEKSILLRIDNSLYPHYVKDGKLIFVGDSWENEYWAAMEYGSADLHVREGSADKIWGGSFVAIDENTVEMRGNFSVPPLSGNYLALRHGQRTHAGVFCQDSENIEVENIELFSSCGIGFMFQFSKNVTVNNISVVPNTERGRKIVSAHDDAIQCSNCGGIVKITGCRFRGMFDDALNIHGTSVLIREITGRKIKCEFIERDSKAFKSYAKAGDVILFSERVTLNAIAECTVKSYRLINDVEFEIEFNSDIPENVRVEDAIENLTNTPEVIFENNFVGSSRARGILITTPKKTVIKNNVFDTSGCAILLSGDANGWFESGACKDVLICDNYFTGHCMSSLYQFCEGIISIYPVIPEPEKSTGYHENITVTRNCFEIAQQPVLYATCVNNISFTENMIIQARQYSEKYEKCTQFEHCSEINVFDNRYFGFARNPEI